MRLDVEHRALVVSTGKNSAWVSVDGETATRVARLRRMSGKRFMPVPGDIVDVRLLDDGEAVVERVHPRALTLERRSAGGRTKTMAANVDTLAVVSALAHPAPRLSIIDRLLAFAELSSVGALVLLTKPDLVAGADAERVPELYRGLGYDVIVVNPKAGDNVGALRDALRGRRAMLAGNSGVGKSTIFRALGGDGAIGDVSRHGIGRQTTTAARLYRFDDGFLIDSPGVSEFGLGGVPAAELAGGFREIRAAEPDCRFRDCTHRAEPGCAVRAGLDSGSIAASRYGSYEQILDAGA